MRLMAQSTQTATDFAIVRDRQGSFTQHSTLRLSMIVASIAQYFQVQMKSRTRIS